MIIIIYLIFKKNGYRQRISHYVVYIHIDNKHFTVAHKNLKEAVTLYIWKQTTNNSVQVVYLVLSITIFLFLDIHVNEVVELRPLIPVTMNHGDLLSSLQPCTN